MDKEKCSGKELDFKAGLIEHAKRVFHTAQESSSDSLMEDLIETVGSEWQTPEEFFERFVTLYQRYREPFLKLFYQMYKEASAMERK